MKKLILTNYQSPGDILMLTATVRDLHTCYPGEFQTDVRTYFPDLWLNNPWITPLDESAADVEVVKCEYPLIQSSNHLPYHFIFGFSDFLNKKFGLNITPTAFYGDIHLSDEEKIRPAVLREVLPEDAPFWLLNAGGKKDFTIKWWSASRYQKVVDRLRGRIQFLQIGSGSDVHHPLEGVISLIGRTTIRDMVRLMYHARGAVSAVSFPMHLAAAVEYPFAEKGIRPCVVIAGAREPVHWEAYPGHQFLHTVGTLPCNANGACWRSRTVPLHDGSEQDEPDKLCVDVVDDLPRCMHLIQPEEVVQKILDFSGFSYEPVQVPPPKISRVSVLSPEEIRKELDAALLHLEPFAEPITTRGIVIHAGGPQWAPAAWVCVKTLRDIGCSLPVELWYAGDQPEDFRFRCLLEEEKVLLRKAPDHIREGGHLNVYAILHASFREVIALEADTVPVSDPSAVFESLPYIATGAQFWPTGALASPDAPAWEVIGVTTGNYSGIDPGMMVLDKKKHWAGLHAALCLVGHSTGTDVYDSANADFFLPAFTHTHEIYAINPFPPVGMEYAIAQLDFNQNRIYQSRRKDRWKLNGNNQRISDFWLGDKCRQHLLALDTKWDGIFREGFENPFTRNDPRLGKVIESLTGRIQLLETKEGPPIQLHFTSDGRIRSADASGFFYWRVFERQGALTLELWNRDSAGAVLIMIGKARWKGVWSSNQGQEIRMSPTEQETVPQISARISTQQLIPVLESDLLVRGYPGGYSGSMGLWYHSLVKNIQPSWIFCSGAGNPFAPLILAQSGREVNCGQIIYCDPLLNAPSHAVSGEQHKEHPWLRAIRYFRQFGLEEVVQFYAKNPFQLLEIPVDFSQSGIAWVDGAQTGETLISIIRLLISKMKKGIILVPLSAGGESSQFWLSSLSGCSFVRIGNEKQGEVCILQPGFPQ